MERFDKAEIKEVKKEGNAIKITMQKVVQMDEMRLKWLWGVVKKREAALKAEKEQLIEIAKQSKIKLE